MDKKFCIFDMDGTLTDSMGYWRALGADYLRAKGARVPEDLPWMVQGMTLAESAAYFMEHCGVAGPPERIVDELNAFMEERYRRDIPLKPGAAEYLDRLRAQGARLCVATATALPLVHACLGRLGVEDRFEFFISCESIGRSKEHPDIFLEAARRFGAEPGACAVFEDALFAARTAGRAGFYTVGVYEPTYESQWPEMRALCCETVEDWRDAR